MKDIFQAQAAAAQRGVADISEALEPRDSAEEPIQWAKKIFDRLQSARQEMAKVIALLHPAIEDPHAEACQLRMVRSGIIRTADADRDRCGVSAA